MKQPSYLHRAHLLLNLRRVPVVVFWWLLSTAAVWAQAVPVHLLKKKLATDPHDTVRISTLHDLVAYYENRSFDSTYYYLNLAEPLVAKYPLTPKSVRIYYLAGNYWQRRSELNKSDVYFEKASRLAGQIKDKSIVIDAQTRIAINEQIRGDFVKSLKRLRRAELMALPVEGQKSSALTRIYSDMAIMFTEFGDSTKATMYATKAGAFAHTPQDSLTYYFTWHFLQSPDNAANLYYGNLALHFARKVQDMQYMCMVTNNIGDYYLTIGQPDKALKYFRETEQIATKFGFEYAIATCQSGYGQVYLQLKDYPKAIYYLKRSLELQQNSDDERFVAENYQDLSTAYYNLGKVEEAISYLQKARSLKDERVNQSTRRMLAQLSAQYELSEKEARMNREKSKSQLQNAYIDRERKQKNYLAMTFFVFMFLAGWAVYNFLLQRRLSSALAEEKTTVERQADDLRNLNYIKDRMFSTLGHDLRSPITELHEMLGLWKNPNVSQKEKQSLTDYLYYRVHNLRNILENLLFWGVVQLKHAKVVVMPVGLDAITKQLCEQVKELLEHKQLTLINRVRAVRVHTDEQQLMIILRNIMTNAIKFTPTKGTITLATHETPQHIELSIEDTGIGMEQAYVEGLRSSFTSRRGTDGEQGTGVGMYICYELTQQLGISLDIQSKKGHGTTMTLRFPKQKTDETEDDYLPNNPEL